MDRDHSITFEMRMWHQFTAGDEKAFSYFYDLYVGHLYRYGSKFTEDAELLKDGIQDVFLDLYERRDKIRVSPERLKYYLFLALKRYLVKKMKRSRRHPEFDVLYGAGDDPCMEEHLIQTEKDEQIRAKLRDAMAKLSSGQKEALYLRFNEMLEYDEMAKVMDISVESVRKQVYRAIRSLRYLLEGESISFLLILFKKSQQNLSMFVLFGALLGN